MTNLNMIKANLRHSNGTGQMYHRMNKNSVYTDGIKYYLAEAEAQWLYDIIESEIYNVLKVEQPDKYYLKFVVADDKGDLLLTDYRGNELLKKHIPFTDAPSGEILFYCGWDGQRMITCTPSED